MCIVAMDWEAPAHADYFTSDVLADNGLLGSLWYIVAVEKIDPRLLAFASRDLYET